MGLFPKKISETDNYLEMMGNAKKQVQSSVDSSVETFENHFQKAVNMLGEFANTNDSKKLKISGQGFLKLIELKPSRVEPYVYLAYILYLYDKKEEAKKYIKISESINSGYQHIKKVKAAIYS